MIEATARLLGFTMNANGNLFTEDPEIINRAVFFFNQFADHTMESNAGKSPATYWILDDVAFAWLIGPIPETDQQKRRMVVWIGAQLKRAEKYLQKNPYRRITSNVQLD